LNDYELPNSPVTTDGSGWARIPFTPTAEMMKVLGSDSLEVVGVNIDEKTGEGIIQMKAAGAEETEIEEVRVEFERDDWYEGDEDKNGKFYITEPDESEIETKDVTTKWGKQVRLEAWLKTKSGSSPISGKRVYFSIDGNELPEKPSNTTSSSGYAYYDYNVPQMTDGNQDLKVEFKGDKDYYRSDDEQDLEIQKHETGIEIFSAEMLVGVEVVVRAKLFDKEYGNLPGIPGKPIEWYEDPTIGFDRELGTIETDDDGISSLRYVPDPTFWGNSQAENAELSVDSVQVNPDSSFADIHLNVAGTNLFGKTVTLRALFNDDDWYEKADINRKFDVESPEAEIISSQPVSRNEIFMSEYFYVTVTARNSGDGEADWGGISISFPEIYSENGNEAAVEVLESYGLSTEFHQKGDNIDRDGTWAPADYLLVEGSKDNGWKPGEERTLKLKVTPKIKQEYTVNIRFALASNNFDRIWRDPDSGTKDEQQKYHVEQYIVDVLGGKGDIQIIAKDHKGQTAPSGTELQLFEYVSENNPLIEYTSLGRGYYDDIEATKYEELRVYKSTPNLSRKEYWGSLYDITVYPGNTSADNIQVFRTMPYGEDIYSKSSTAPYELKNSFLPGERVALIAKAQNPTNSRKQVKVKIQVKHELGEIEYEKETPFKKVPPNGNYEWTIDFTPDRTGNYYARILKTTTKVLGTVVTDTWAWPKNATFQVSQPPIIAVNHESIDFGETQPNTSIENKNLVVHNKGQGNLIINKAEITGSSFSIISPQLPFLINSGNSQTFRLGFQPTSPGSFQEILTLVNNDADNKRKTIQLSG
ncbi:choice-of-anchor D domain-containing protein, partial [candidate division KSB1 bacterium]